MPRSFPDEVLDHILSFIDTHSHSNSVSLVCKPWYEIERQCRHKIFIRNCYSISPGIAIRRFPELRSLSLKRKPHFADFNLVPDGWGGGAYPWIAAMAEACPKLEELRLKRLKVTDEELRFWFCVLVMTDTTDFDLGRRSDFHCWTELVKKMKGFLDG